MRRICLGLLVACAAMLGLCASASATSLSYTFDSGNEGWTQNQDQGNPIGFAPAGFLSTGGDPGGHLQGTDTGAETGCPTNSSPCHLLTLYSPIVSILGANYDGTVSFDLRSPDMNPRFAAEVLLLPAGLNYLDGLIPLVSDRDYNHLSISLNETANWTVCPKNGGLCVGHPTQLVLKNLLGAADQFAVMVDVGDGTGESYYLDNFAVTDGPPVQPTTPTTNKKKCKKGKKGKKSKRRAVTAKKKCKKKRRAAVATLRG